MANQLFDLTGRQALVIGAGSGIGQAIARGFTAAGARVIAADIDSAAAAGVEGAEPVTLDMADSRQVAEVARAYPGLEILVCTPSVNVRKRIADTTPEEFRRVVSLNLEGLFHVLREFGPVMARNGKGSIIAFSSIRAQVVEPGQGAYAATKAGIVQLVRTLAAELGPQGVRVNVIAPGVVETPLTAQIKADPEWYGAYAAKPILGRWAQPEELVGAAIFLASDASSYVTGSYLAVDGGWLAADGRYSPDV
ncbi:MAG TPA: SDR family oxidoreductase [Mycobacteriales bacterium]|nr:SDR family oxidoreductase [Mycobacteriales bacterium]